MRRETWRCYLQGYRPMKIHHHYIILYVLYYTVCTDDMYSSMVWNIYRWLDFFFLWVMSPFPTGGTEWATVHQQRERRRLLTSKHRCKQIRFHNSAFQMFFWGRKRIHYLCHSLRIKTLNVSRTINYSYIVIVMNYNYCYVICSQENSKAFIWGTL